MSFLPHAAPRRDVWFGAMGISTVAHGALAALLMSGAVVFLPEGQPADSRESAFAVSLEILDAEIVEEADPIEDDRIPPDAIATLPEEMETTELEEDFAALTPEDNLLEPDAPEGDLTEPVEEAIAPDEEVLEEEVASTEAINPEPQEPDLLAPDLAEDIAEPDLSEPELVEPEELAPEVAEIAPAPTPLDTQPLTIDDLSLIEDDIISPLAEGGSGAPLEPEIVTEDDTLALLAPEPDLLAPSTIGPSETDDGSEAVVLPDPDTIAPVAEPEIPAEDDPTVEDTPEAEESAQTEDTALAAAPLQNVSQTDLAIGRLLRRIRAFPHPQCTLALPRRAGDAPGAGVSFVGAEEDTLIDLSQRITDGLDPAPVQTREIVDPRQCAVLDALRQADSYPANRIGLSLEDATLLSGETLRGRVLGAGGLFVTLLVIDDNGVVQDLAPFVSLDGNIPVFDAPVARSGPSRATRQMLIALGTTDAPLDLSDRIGREAQDVFAPIPADVLKNMVFGLVTFDVQ